MRIIALILVFLSPLALSAATVSGEATLKKPAVTQKTPAPKITYYAGKKWGCYTIVKNKKTKKDIKKYVDKKFCAKK